MHFLFNFNHFYSFIFNFIRPSFLISNNADEAARWGWWRRRRGRQRYDEADGEDEEKAGDDGKDEEEAGDDDIDDEEEAFDDGGDKEEAGKDKEEADDSGNEEEMQTEADWRLRLRVDSVGGDKLI